LGNSIKYLVVIPKVRDIENSHPELLSDKLVHISYGPLVLRFRARVEFTDGGFELIKGFGDIELWDSVRGHPSVSLPILSFPTLPLIVRATLLT
jgi:hypothetical protein